MKTGERLVVGLVGCIWSGVQGSDGLCADRVDISTVYEDHPHGANMQCTVLLRNLSRAALCSNRLPERLTVSADNTAKETKNNTTLCFFVWLLCYLGNSSLWCVRTVYKMVGHTHDNLDRFFSRVAMALRGRTYISQSDLQEVVSRTLRSYRIAWSHSHSSYNFEPIRQGLGIHIKRMRNLHDMEVFRTDGGIFLRWKQWMTDDAWSLPRKLLDADQIEIIAKTRPPGIPHQFESSKANSGLGLVAKLEAELQASSGISSNVAIALRELRSIWKGEANQQTSSSIEDLLASLGGRNSSFSVGRTVSSSELVSASVPSDVLYQSCPGHDVVGVPVETLVEVSGPNFPSVGEVGKSTSACVLGDLLIACVDECKSKLPFFLGILRDIQSDGHGLVEWMHPLKSTECKFIAGKKKQMLDIFGSWMDVDGFSLSELENLPSPILHPKNVLAWGFELTESSEIPFEVLDLLLDNKGLDFTGLSLSATARGNLYRTHRLMQGARGRN